MLEDLNLKIACFNRELLKYSASLHSCDDWLSQEAAELSWIPRLCISTSYSPGLRNKAYSGDITAAMPKNLASRVRAQRLRIDMTIRTGVELATGAQTQSHTSISHLQELLGVMTSKFGFAFGPRTLPSRSDILPHGGSASGHSWLFDMPFTVG